MYSQDNNYYNWEGRYLWITVKGKDDFHTWYLIRIQTGERTEVVGPGDQRVPSDTIFAEHL